MNATHQTALDQALQWIKSNFNPTGIIVSGSIIRGNPDANSDFDIYVIHNENYKQRLQKFFNNTPCEIFVNNPAHIYAFYEEESKRNKPSTADMFATGKIYSGDKDPEILKLIETAKQYLGKPFVLDAKQREGSRYTIATLFEDATDTLDKDPATCTYFLNKTMQELLDFFFAEKGIPPPRTKERIQFLLSNYPETGELISRYYLAEQLKERYAIAKKLVVEHVGVLGFFEWSSERVI